MTRPDMTNAAAACRAASDAIQAMDGQSALEYLAVALVELRRIDGMGPAPLVGSALLYATDDAMACADRHVIDLEGEPDYPDVNDDVGQDDDPTTWPGADPRHQRDSV